MSPALIAHPPPSPIFPSPRSAFPLLRSIGPGLISALWGIFVFGELKGKKNYLLVLAAFICIATAAIIIGLST